LTPEYCAAQADACVAFARTAEIDPVRVMLHHIAGTWKRIADELRLHH